MISLDLLWPSHIGFQSILLMALPISFLYFLLSHLRSTTFDFTIVERAINKKIKEPVKAISIAIAIVNCDNCIWSIT